MIRPLGIALFAAALVTLGWYAVVTSKTVQQQSSEIRELKASIAAASEKQGLADQMACAASAQQFLSSRGWKPGEGDTYENHFNGRLKKCFVLVSAYLFNEDFRSIDLYDAVGGRHYATYNGHNMCILAVSKCASDGGSLWFDGNDSRQPPDFMVGFRGLLYGGGAGDEQTQRAFLDRVRTFMTQ
jgi:hypothetical protein